jgi:two-component system response regulator AtoC
MRILVIDDEVEVATLLADTVRTQGHEASVAHDGAAGLALLAEARPDAVFLDVRMPDMSGIALLRIIRERYGALPVILITGHAVAEELEEAQRLGVTEIIDKPFFLTHLGDALAGLGARG